jgi:hypothetical protein
MSAPVVIGGSAVAPSATLAAARDEQIERNFPRYHK